MNPTRRQMLSAMGGLVLAGCASSGDSKPNLTWTETKSPTPTPVSDGESYSYSGGSDNATEKFELAGGLATFELSHRGDSNFAVWLLNSDGEQEELLVNAIGPWDGRVAYNATNQDYLLDIEANGSWTVSVRQPRYTSRDVASLPESLETTNSDYLGPVRLEGLTRATLDASDDDNYAVWSMNHHGEKVDLLFNEIGPYEGDTAFNADGIAMIQVETNGEYAIEFERG